MLNRLPLGEQDCVCTAGRRQQLLAIRYPHDIHDIHDMGCDKESNDAPHDSTRGRGAGSTGPGAGGAMM